MRSCSSSISRILHKWELFTGHPSSGLPVYLWLCSILRRRYVAHDITCLHMMLRFVYCDSGVFQVASLSLLSSSPLIHLPSSTNPEVSISSNRKEPGLLFPSEEIRRAATFRFVLPPQAPLMLLPWIPAQRVLASRIDGFIVETTSFPLAIPFRNQIRGVLSIRLRQACVSRAPLQ